MESHDVAAVERESLHRGRAEHITRQRLSRIDATRPIKHFSDKRHGYVSHAAVGRLVIQIPDPDARIVLIRADDVAHISFQARPLRAVAHDGVSGRGRPAVGVPAGHNNRLAPINRVRGVAENAVIEQGGHHLDAVARARRQERAEPLFKRGGIVFPDDERQHDARAVEAVGFGARQFAVDFGRLEVVGHEHLGVGDAVGGNVVEAARPRLALIPLPDALGTPAFNIKGRRARRGGRDLRPGRRSGQSSHEQKGREQKCGL